MSFGQGFGVGFDTIASATRQQFNELCDLDGQEIILVTLTQVDVDAYGDPIFSEEEVTTKGFPEPTRVDDKELPPGRIFKADMTFRVKAETIVTDRGYEIEYLEKRWKILGVRYLESHTTIYSQRKIHP